MADVHRLPGVRKVEQEASEWIARLDADDVTAEDRARFEAWRRAHPCHARAFEDLSQTWHRFLKAAPAVGESMVDDSLNLRRANARRRLWGGALAAAAILLTVLGGLYIQRPVAAAPFKTAVGEQLTVPLPDGSSLELNSNSQARVDYSSRRRIIHLDRGEAFFKVAHDARRPFWVTAGGGWVRVVGTEFNVYLRPASLQVTVRDGTVQAGESRDLRTTAQPDAQKLTPWVTLTRGQQADLDPSAARKRALSPDELAEAVSWRSGTVYFENRPLAEVVTELNRYSAEQLILEDAALRTLRVGGTFQTGPQGAAALRRMLEQNYDIGVHRRGTDTYLRSPAHPLAQ
jgi:transmembrane sensor